jgi:hypothetical protein
VGAAAGGAVRGPRAARSTWRGATGRRPGDEQSVGADTPMAVADRHDEIVIDLAVTWQICRIDGYEEVIAKAMVFRQRGRHHDE